MKVVTMWDLCDPELEAEYYECNDIDDDYIDDADMQFNATCAE